MAGNGGGIPGRVDLGDFLATETTGDLLLHVRARNAHPASNFPSNRETPGKRQHSVPVVSSNYRT